MCFYLHFVIKTLTRGSSPLDTSFIALRGSFLFDNLADYCTPALSYLACMCIVHRLNFVVLHSLINWCHHRYLKAGKSGMTIMDIGIFSGFTPDKDSLVEVNRKKFLFVCGTSVPLSCSAFKLQACARGSILAGRALFPAQNFRSVRSNYCHAKYSKKLKLLQNSVKEIKVGNRKGLDFRTQIFLSWPTHFSFELYNKSYHMT